ncbi:hypothetical protein [Micromonospora sp. NPDC023956]|uniref:hypothetical protein n=1 Tax=Micromonospora sp. NPDC023956 TaxID=3155722 RepID=UPI0033E8BE0C
MKCFICGGRATVLVVVSNLTGPDTRYAACDDHEPRHIPGGNVVSITVTPI